MKLFSGFAALALVATTSAVSAQNAPQANCMREIGSICGMSFSRDKIAGCIKEKFSQFSPQCKAKLVEMAKRVRARQAKPAG